MAENLKKEGINLQRPKIIAKTGWTTGDLLQAIQQEELSGNFDLISLLIGVNNQYRGSGINNYQNELEVLINISIALAHNIPGNVFLVSIPDYSITPFGQEKNPVKIRKELENYNEVKKGMAEKYSLAFIDITPLSREAQKDQTLLAEDLLHPSPKMYKEWVKLISPKVLEKIPRQSGS